MSTSRIPFTQVFKSSKRDSSLPTQVDLDGIDFQPRDITPPPRGRQQAPPNPNNNMSQPVQVPFLKGTRTPQLLEYERQAAERLQEQQVIAAERARMLEAERQMQKERERIEQEEYEMRQYYEAEALKHEQELRAHQEEVKRHQEKVRLHERMVADHEASSEAFARVIAMPVEKKSGRMVSFFGMNERGGGGGKGGRGSIGSLDGYTNGGG